jgi:hypothetical protein
MPLLPIWESRTQSCAGALNRRTPPKMGFPTWLPVYPFHRFWDRSKDLPSGIENGPVEIVDLPSYKMVMFHRYVNVYQRVNNPNHTSSGNIPLVMCTRCLHPNTWPRGRLWFGLIPNMDGHHMCHCQNVICIWLMVIPLYLELLVLVIVTFFVLTLVWPSRNGGCIKNIYTLRPFKYPSKIGKSQKTLGLHCPICPRYFEGLGIYSYIIHGYALYIPNILMVNFAYIIKLINHFSRKTESQQ